MTARDLRNYKNLNRVINLMKKRVVELSTNTVRDSVRGSNPNYPYEERSFSLVGAEDSLVYDKRLKEAEESLEYYESVKEKIEKGISLIEDPTDRLILEYTLQGKSRQLTADFLDISQSLVSLRLKKIVSIFNKL